MNFIMGIFVLLINLKVERKIKIRKLISTVASIVCLVCFMVNARAAKIAI